MRSTVSEHPSSVIWQAKARDALALLHGMGFPKRLAVESARPWPALHLRHVVASAEATQYGAEPGCAQTLRSESPETEAFALLGQMLRVLERTGDLQSLEPLFFRRLAFAQATHSKTLGVVAPVSGPVELRPTRAGRRGVR